MPKQARVGDTTQGFCTHSIHLPNIPFATGGTITSGAGKTTDEGPAAARVGDVVTSNCGHGGTINSGSGKVIIEGAAAARVGDSFSGTYSGTITGGAAKTETI